MYKVRRCAVPLLYNIGGPKLYVVKISIADYPGVELNEKYPHVRGLRGGTRLFAALHHNVEARDIPVRYSTAAERLITGPDGAVVGVQLRDSSGVRRVRTRGGVILPAACSVESLQEGSFTLQLRPQYPAHLSARDVAACEQVFPVREARGFLGFFRVFYENSRLFQWRQSDNGRIYFRSWRKAFFFHFD